MTAPTSLFVYGTLRQGQPNAFLLEPFADSIEAGWIDGQLCDVEGWPGLVTGKATVWGEIVKINPARHAELLNLVDDLEDFDPDDPQSSSYLRKAVPAMSESGVECEVYAYFFNVARGSGIDSTPLIAIRSGDWLRP